MGRPIALKPCPFCAGDAYYDYGHTKYGWYAIVKCEDCYATTKLVSIKDDDGLHEKKYYDDMDHSFWDAFDDVYPYKAVANCWNQRKRRRKED